MKIWSLGFVLLVGPSLVFAVSKEDIRGVVRSNLKDVKACYKLMLERRDFTGEREGKVVIAWSVDSSGKVVKESVVDDKTTLKNAELHSCIFEKLKTWEFPKAPEGQFINITAYPFVFKDEEKK